MIKIPCKVGIGGNLVSPIEAIYKITTAHTVNGERLNAFPPKSRTNQRYPFIKLVFNIIVEVLAREALS